MAGWMIDMSFAASMNILQGARDTTDKTDTVAGSASLSWQGRPECGPGSRCDGLDA
jgi:hypothetical protein